MSNHSTFEEWYAEDCERICDEIETWLAVTYSPMERAVMSPAGLNARYSGRMREMYREETS